MSGSATITNSQVIQDRFSVYDHPELQREYLRSSEESQHQAVLQLDNVRCAGCCAAIEKAIAAIPGVIVAEVNYTTHQLTLDWNADRLALSKILRDLYELGYPGQPVNSVARNQSLVDQRKAFIRQIGVAGALGMQIMVLSVCLYTGEWWGIDASLATFFRYLSLALVVPVLAYAGQPFYASALSDLKHGRVGMDVPITLGLTVAFTASVYALLTGRGDTYFDSISMFVFLVLGARLIELNHRMRAMASLGHYDTVLPASAVRVDDDGSRHRLPTLSLRPGDSVFVAAGEVVPADGVISHGESSFDESLLTGESLPVVVHAGAGVVAGSINIENPVTVQITNTGDDTQISAIGQLVKSARFDKPAVSRLVERLASWFVALVLTVAATVAIVGYVSGSGMWLSSTIAVLIVSCPCALALATPAAVSMATGKVLREGFVVLNSRSLETLEQASHYFFDKTGTLTTGLFSVSDVQAEKDLSRERAIQIARSLEQYSSHPIANAISQLTSNALENVIEVQTQAGGGLSGEVDGQHRYFIGSANYIQKNTGYDAREMMLDGKTVAVLADDQGVQGVFTLQDQVRPGADELIATLKRQGKKVSMLSGDRQSAVENVANRLGITDYHYSCSPQDKLELVEQATARGEVTAMFGDGINDAPVVGGSHVSIAMGEQVNMTSVNADVVALKPDIPAIKSLLRMSRRLSVTIRQNLSWALGYNAIAIPFAAIGLVPPWLAAIGMSLSSLVVVLNAARLGRN